jgi:hypothetical protein
MESFVIVATLDVRFKASCHMAWLGSFALCVKSFGVGNIGVATLGVGFTTSSCRILRGIFTKDGLLCRRRDACHVVCHPEGHYRSISQKKLSLYPKSSQRLDPRIVIGFVTLVPFISSAK